MRLPVSGVVNGVAIALVITIFALRANSSGGKKQLYTHNPFAEIDTTHLPQNGERERIYIENVDLWKYDQEVDSQAEILVGNVVLRHNNAYMYCDSAKLYQKQNRFEGFSNVRIVEGDSLNITCEYINYDGVTMLARLRELVVMQHRDNTLYTDSLDYDRISGLGYYFDSGSIVDTLNTLSSIYGEYDTNTKEAVFQQNVVLENPNFTLYSDTLHYDTETKIADILGPTRIEGDSGIIYATKGRYDTEKDLAYLMNQPVIVSGTRRVTGDSIFYDRGAKRSEIYGNINMKDTIEQVALRGNFAVYHEDIGYGFAQDSAYIEQYGEKDTLYVHSLMMEMIKVDSATNLIKGLGNARLFRKDVQGVADSIIYHTSDSVMHCYGHPFLWSGKSQVTGDTITMYIKNGKMDYAHIQENAFLSSKIDTESHFNQLRGREVLAYFSDDQMDSVWIKGNAEVIYYSENADSIATEHIKSQSSAILMRFEDEEISLIKLMDRTVGTILPINLVDPDQLFYPDFIWFPDGRPTDFADIFRKTPMRPVAPPDGTSTPEKGLSFEQSEESITPADENTDKPSDEEPVTATTEALPKIAKEAIAERQNTSQ